jgi:lipoprotein-anchoring transpeptidase ErfK/SrfK
MVLLRVKDPKEFRSPRRRPWLLLLVVAAAGLFAFQRYWAGRSRPPDGEARGRAGQAARPPDGPSPVAPPAAPESPAALAALVEESKALEARRALVEARDKYVTVLTKKGIAPDVRQDIEGRLGRVNIELIMTPVAMPEKVEYVIQSGDSIDRIARKFGTTRELVEKSNQIRRAAMIRKGDRLRVFNGRFAIAVNVPKNELVLYMNGKFFKKYAIGTGEEIRSPTPMGTFRIVEKTVKPSYWPRDGHEVPYGDPANPLGTRWMRLMPTGSTPSNLTRYGLHGTSEDSSIGRSVSAGCVRLRNADVEELFALVPDGTSVTITR